MSGAGKRSNTLATDSLAAANLATSSPSVKKKRQDSLAAATLPTSSPSAKKKRQDSLAAATLATSSPSAKKKRQEQDHDDMAGQPSDEVMNALFEQVVVSYQPD